MAIERLFTFKDGSSPSETPNSFDPGDPETYKQFIHALITDSRDYENSVLAPKRDEAQKYYYGMLPSLNPNGSPYSDTLIVEDPQATYEEILGPGEGPTKSSFVSTDVRDAILMMLPSLVRIFAASENVISLVPRTPQDEATAEQATAYVNYVFWQDNPGFLTLYGAFKDALTVKTGYIKWWTDNAKAVKRKQFVNITMEQLQMLLGEDQSAKVVPGSLQQSDPSTGGIDVTIEATENKPITRVEGVPPEEMRLDRYARTFAKSRIVGHERIVSIDELTAMGYPRDLAANYLQTQDVHNFTMESMIRNPGRGMSTRVGDGVLYGEWYVRVDTDGDGVAELRYICTMGEDHAIVRDEPANRIKVALFSVDPISHTLVGDSIADLTVDIQRIKTNMTRGVLDSLAESINPRTRFRQRADHQSRRRLERRPRRGHPHQGRSPERGPVRHHSVRRPAGPAGPRIPRQRAAAPHRLVRRRQGARSQAIAVLDPDRRRGDHQRPAGAHRTGGAGVSGDGL